MSDFNQIRYGAVIEFLMLENVQPQVLVAQLNDCCLWWRCAIIRHGQVMDCRVFCKAEQGLK